MIFFFLPCCVILLKKTLQECWILVGLLLFSLVSILLLLRRKSATLGFHIKLQLFKLKLRSPSWSGTLPELYRSFLSNEMMSKYCDLDYHRIIRTSSSFLYAIEIFWFGLQPCQKLDSFSECKNSLLFQL